MENSQLDDIDVVKRALALRRRGRIGVLWAESGRFYLSESEFNPHGSRVRISLAKLRELVEALEATEPKRKAPGGVDAPQVAKKATA